MDALGHKCQDEMLSDEGLPGIQDLEKGWLLGSPGTFLCTADLSKSAFLLYTVSEQPVSFPVKWETQPPQLLPL